MPRPAAAVCMAGGDGGTTSHHGVALGGLRGLDTNMSQTSSRSRRMKSATPSPLKPKIHGPARARRPSVRWANDLGDPEGYMTGGITVCKLGSYDLALQAFVHGG